MRSLMVACIDLWDRSVAVEGASISMSRWNNSHQKGVELMESVYVLVMAWMVCACRRRKFERLRCLRWWRPYIVTPAKLAPDFGIQAHLWSENDTIASWFRLIFPSEHSIHPY